MKIQQRKAAQQGMTLIEILIAMLIGVILLGGILSIFTNSKQTYRMQEAMSRLQENSRFATEFISHDLRMADYWGCLGSSVGNIDNNLNPDPAYDDILKGIEGSNDDNGGNDGDADNDENGNSIWDGTDSLTINGVSESDIYVYQVPASVSADIKVTLDSGLLEDEVVIVSDCSVGDMFQITSDPATGGGGVSDNLVHNTGGGGAPPGNADNTLQKKYDTDAQVFRIRSLNYSIRNGAGNQPSLYRSINGVNEELVEGIEDMQILFGADTDADGAANYYVAAGTVGLDMDQVISVRISLLARSIDNNITSQPVPYTFNGTTITPADRRLRKVSTITIAIRNRLI